MFSVLVRYFAILREQRGCTTETVPCEVGTTVAELYEQLFPKSSGGQILVGMAVNHLQVPGETVLQEGDEVVFLPPLGGG